MIYQALTSVVDIIYLIGKVAEIAATVVALGIPVVGKFDLGAFVSFCREEYQCEASFLAVVPLSSVKPSA